MPADTEKLAEWQAAWEASSKGDRSEPLRLADEYVDAHPELEAKYGEFKLPQLVTLLSEARREGDVDLRNEIDIWLLHAFEPQQIGGRLEPRRRQR